MNAIENAKKYPIHEDNLPTAPAGFANWFRKFVRAILLAALFLTTGTSAVSLGAVGSNQKPDVAEKEQKRVDLYGEPLPPGAIARMGTIQFRHPHHKNKDYSEPSVWVAFSPDGKVIATSSWEDRLRLWNANTGRLLLEIEESGGIGLPVFSPDGRFIAATLAYYSAHEGSKSYACLWDAKTGKLAHRFLPTIGTRLDVRDLLFSPDSKLLAMTDEKGAIYLWNANAGKQVAVLAQPGWNAPMAFIAFSADGKTLVTVPYEPGKVWHWDIGRSVISKVISFDENEETKGWRLSKQGRTEDWKLSNDGRTLACRFPSDRIVRLLDTSNGKVRCRLQQEVDATYGNIAFTPDGRFMATLEHTDADDRKMIVSLCDTETGKLKQQFKIPSQRTRNFIFSPDGSRIIVGGWHNYMYDVATGKELLRKPAHEGSITALAFTADSSTLISGSVDGMIGIWDAASGKSRHFIEGHRSGCVTGLAIVPAGSTFVSCGQDGIIRLIDWRSGIEVRHFGFNDDLRQFRDLKVSSDGKTLTSQIYTGRESKESPFHSWDLATGKLLGSHPKSSDANVSDLTTDGKYFIGMKYLTEGRNSTSVELRELASGKLVFTALETDTFWSQQNLLTPGGRLLIDTIAHATPTGHYVHPAIHLRELATGAERLCIVTKEDGFHYEKIALSPDGRILATARFEKILQLWDLHTGKELLRRSGYADSVAEMTVSPNGKFLATGHGDGSIFVWDISLLQDNPSRMTRSAKELDSWWKDLAGVDATKAHTAIGNLVEVPEQAVGLFKERLRPARDNSERIARLIAQLDDDKFAIRQAASKELETLRSEAEAAPRRAHKENKSTEVQTRIERILEQPVIQVRDPKLTQGIRAVEVLEYIATGNADESRQAAINLLKNLTGGAPQARLTLDATAALRRLEMRKP